MRLVLRLTITLICIIASPMLAHAQSATIVTLSTGRAQVEVNLDKLNPYGESTGGLFIVQSGQLKQITSQIVPDGATPAASYRRFHFEFPDATPYNPEKTYRVVLFTPVTDTANNSGIVASTLTVTKRLELSLLRSDLRCSSGILVLATAKVRPNEIDWSAIYRWLEEHNSSPQQLATVQLRVIGEDKKKPYRLESISPETPQSLAQKSGEMYLCLKTQDKLPVGAFAAEIEFHGNNRPADFGPTVEAKELAGRYITSATSSELKDPGERALEQNLDLGVSFTSSVANKEVPATATEPAIMTRERTNRGVLDIRFAPTLNLLNPVIVSNKWLHFFTPIYLNANVATGKIEEDTLSLNRVLIGMEGEARYNVRRTTIPDNPATPQNETRYVYPVTHRLVYGLTHASDRDFKQREFTGKIEYKPIIWKLNNPINLNYTVRNGEKRPGTFGFVFLPTVGFEIGRTYHRRNPAPAITASDTIRRFYLGIEMNLDITRHVTFFVKDTFYVRGETLDDRAKNYFKGGIEAPLGAVFDSAVQSLFFSFERGDLAPFATPSVNVLKMGYRIQLNYCRKCR